jgi:hypothetical protein
MALSSIYADRVRGELRGAIDTRKLAETWAALHPPGLPAVPDAALAAFTDRARKPIEDAYQRVLPKAATEGWVLGQQAARAMAHAPAAKSLAKDETVEADFPPVDWAGWEPGDYEAALQVADGGLEYLLGQQGIAIKSIAASRLEELGNVLAEFVASESASRPLLPDDLPPEYSVGSLADALEGVLDNPERAMMVAHTEIARASSAASMDVFSLLKVGRVRVSTAADKRVCPRCAAAEAAGPQPLTAVATVPLHPLCRCAIIPVLPSLPTDTAGAAAAGEDAAAVELGSAAEADAWLAENATGLSADEAEAVDWYTASGSADVNRVLRDGGGMPEVMARMAALLDSAMGPLAAAVVLQRVVGADAFGGSAVLAGLAGAVIADAGYASASALLPAWRSGEVLMHITAPAGTPAVVIGPAGSVPGEREVLLPRGVQLRVDRVGQGANGQWEVWATVVEAAAKAGRKPGGGKGGGSTLRERMADAVYTVVSS